MNVALCLLFGYLIGTLNPAYLFGRLRGIDIRKGGSGNAGATNATLLLGKATGFLTAFLDITKSYIACKTASWLFPALAPACVVAGCGCILGHIFPVWMGFAGGKGLACLGGMLLAYNWRILCLMLLGEIVMLCFFNYICLVAITGSAAFTVVYWFHSGDPLGTSLLAAVAVVIFCKHIPNLQRIADGSELKIRYLWDKEGETRRVQEKHPDLHL
ncbi:MAG: glycerol-3-phosphate acyltransferase [Oscillospiraceae bacterium]|nr:glycerol-3-phosphate acyltransferase [Oscillospiraceae bacterium]